MRSVQRVSVGVSRLTRDADDTFTRDASISFLSPLLFLFRTGNGLNRFHVLPT